MKIRIKGNAVRFRLTKTEVETFCKTGFYEELTEFETKNFGYRVEMRDHVQSLQAKFVGDTIIMVLPRHEGKDWFDSDRVGFNGVQVLDNGKSLSLLLEKDFVCLDETVEDQSDNYPNPLAK